MLKKLLKYDLENIFKVLTILYIFIIIFSILTRILFSIENSLIINIIAQISSGVTIALILNILINNLTRSWLRFKNNLYGDESYLTHTLPVEKKSLYQSKFLASLISLLISIFIILLSLAIAFYSKENIQVLKKILLPMIEAYHSTIIKFLLIIAVVIFLEFANILQAGYTGILLGHRKNQKKVGYSVFYAFITYFLIQLVTLFVLFLSSLFQEDMLNLFITNEIVNLDMLKILMYLAIGTYTGTMVINYLINLKLLKKGVNVD